MATLQILLGLAFLFVGGEALVRGAVGAAQRLNVSPLVTGLVLVGFGTSMPELVTSLKAALDGAPGIAVGNVVGSNLANILLILGVTAAIYPIAAEPKAFRRDGPMLLVATALAVLFALNGAFERLTGALFVCLLTAYIAYVYLKERKTPDAQAEMHAAEATLASPAPRALWLSLIIAAAGVAALIVGANSMVTGAIAVSRAFGVPESVIGLTVVAIGTSLPELASSITAAVRKQTDIAFGNILGSNIFNLFGIIGATAIVSPISIPPKVLTYDLWVMAAATILLLVFAFTGARITRREGAAFLGCYAAYLAFLTFRTVGTV